MFKSVCKWVYTRKRALRLYTNEMISMVSWWLLFCCSCCTSMGQPNRAHDSASHMKNNLSLHTCLSKQITQLTHGLAGAVYVNLRNRQIFHETPASSTSHNIIPSANSKGIDPAVRYRKKKTLIGDHASSQRSIGLSTPQSGEDRTGRRTRTRRRQAAHRRASRHTGRNTRANTRVHKATHPRPHRQSKDCK